MIGRRVELFDGMESSICITVPDSSQVLKTLLVVQDVELDIEVMILLQECQFLLAVTA